MRFKDWQQWLYTDWGISVLFHLFLLILLMASVGFSFEAESVDVTDVAQPVVINASFVDPKVTQAKFDEAQRQKRQAEEAKRQAQAQKRKAEQDRKRRIEQARKKKEAEKRKQRELERKAAAEVERKKREAEIAEQKRKEEVSAEAKRKAEAEAAEQALREALAAEQAAIAAEQQKRVLSEKQRYAALIKATIQRNLITNDAFRGKTCRLNIRLGIGGVVLKADVLSGDDALCRAAITAVYKPSNLPVSRDPAVFAELKNINLTVEQ